MTRWFGVRENGKTWTKGNMNRLPGIHVGVLLLVSATWASVGCDSESFVPPRPAELRGVGGGATNSTNTSDAGVGSAGIPSSAKVLELILDRHSADESEVLKAAALKQAGLDKARTKFALLGENEPSTRQAALVREAVARHPLALIIEPADLGDPGLALAVREAQDAGVIVVMLGRDLAGPQPAEASHADAKTAKAGAVSVPVHGTQASPGSRPRIVVAPPPFATSAGLLVASAVRSAKNGQIAPQKKAVILLDTTSDAFVEPRVTAIRDALKAAGITTIKEIRFNGDAKRAQSLLTEFLLANPDYVMVFSLDHQSFIASREVINELAAERPMISAGYTSDEQLAKSIQYGEFAALAEYVPTRLIRKAITIAITAAQGRDVPRIVEVPIIFHDSNEKTGLSNAPRSQASSKKKKTPE
jgi:ABC-type sugar transport system substrate-binding protein